MSKTFSLHVHVPNFIATSRFPSDYKDVFQNTDGTTLKPTEARTFLQGELAKGRKVIPCSGECGNPCAHADNGCTGFDYAGGGCPGRNTQKTSEAATAA